MESDSLLIALAAGFAGFLIGLVVGRSLGQSKRNDVAVDHAIDGSGSVGMPDAEVNEAHSDRPRNEGLTVNIIRPAESEYVASVEYAVDSEAQPVEMPNAEQDNEFYLTTPSLDGEFDDSTRKTRFTPNESVFRIILLDGDSMSAEFSLADRPDAIELAMRRRDIILDPIAESVSPFKRGHVTVTTVQPGIIELDSGVWRVRKKMLVQYS